MVYPEFACGELVEFVEGSHRLPPETDPPPEEMAFYYTMYFLYILKNIKENWHYIGSTSDVVNRVHEHNAGEVRSTKAYRPLTLVYQEEFNNKSEARKRELFLKKTARARKELFEKIDGPIV